MSENDNTPGGIVQDSHGRDAPESVDGIDLRMREECPVCLDREGYVEGPAGYYKCLNCFSVWAGDIENADLVTYNGPEVSADV